MPTRPSVRATLPFVAGWTVLSLLLSTTASPGPLTMAEGAFAVVLGVMLGVVSAWFELAALPRYGRRTSPGVVVAVRTVLYAAGLPLLLMGLVGAGWAVRRVGGNAAFEVYGPAQTLLYFRTGEFAGQLVLATAASFVVNFFRQVRLVVGPGALWALFTGRYRLPVEEERAFLFLDLTGSTATAQRLGPALFNEFKNDFFRDVAGPVLATGGRIYQYVGDEVVVTWRVRNGRLPRSPVETFLQLDEAVARNAEQYTARYGVVPTYKAGLHCGPVVTAEVGEIKKDIVHSGDAVNVTSRIEGQCHALGARLLVSEAALALAPLPPGVVAEDVGAVDLRGREGPVRLFRLGLPGPATRA